MNRRELLATAAAAPFVLAFAPRLAAALRGGSPLALVTADREAHVVAVALLTGRVVKRIPTATGPRSIESWQRTTAVVAHTEFGVVSLLDGVTLTVRRVVKGFEQPRYTAVRPPVDTVAGSAAIAYVTDSLRKEVVTLDLARGAIVDRTSVPGPARHVSISPDGSTLWTALGTKATQIAVLDVRDAVRPRLVRTISPPFLVHDVVFAPDGKHVWVTSGSRGAIALYTPRGARPTRVLRAHSSPQHVAFAGGLALVASGDDGTVRVHRPDGALVRTARVPVGSYNVTYGWQRAVTPSLERGTVCVLDASGRVRTTRRVARAAHDACVVVSS